MPTLSIQPPRGSYVGAAEVRELIARACPAVNYAGKKVLLLVPDATRTCPLGMLFTALFDQISAVTESFDVMVALGTHPPMSDKAICKRLKITLRGAQHPLPHCALLQPRLGPS